MRRGLIFKGTLGLAEELAVNLMLMCFSGLLISLLYLGILPETCIPILAVELIALWTIAIFCLFRMYLIIKEVKDDKRQ